MHSFTRTVASTLALIAAVPALAGESSPPAKSDLPKSPEQYITITSTKPPIVVRPRVDASQEQPNPQDFYTPELQRGGLEGTALVDVFVLADGTAGEMRIKQSSGAEALDDAAKAAVERMRFVPGTLDGNPSPMWARYAITFKVDSRKRAPATVPSSTP